MDKGWTTADDVLYHVDQLLAGFINDPADTDYQRGYEAGLRELRAIYETPIGEKTNG